MKKSLVVLAIVSVLILVACGGGGSSSNTIPTPTPGPTPVGSFSQASLSGRYVYNVHGAAGIGSFAALGVFTADGAGNITSGTEEGFTSNTGSYSSSFTGTYTVAADGRVLASQTMNGRRVTLMFVLISTARGRIMQLDGLDNAIGTLDRQDSAAINALSGTYVLRLDGNESGFPYSAMGAVTASGGASGTLTGTMDENDGGSATPDMAVNGSYTIGTGGRGTALLNTPFGPANYIFYVVNASKIQVLSTDPTPQVSGSGTLQTGVFSTASMNGNFVFMMAGTDGSGVIREAGRFTLNGGGTLTGGTEDLLDAGSFFESVPFTGMYSVNANGQVRATFTFSGSTFQAVMWMTSPTTGFILSSDPTSVESGYVAMQSGSFNNATLNGNYAFAMNGSTGSIVDVVAQINSDGVSAFNGNQYYLSVATNTSVAADGGFPGTYAMAATGRATAVFNGVAMRVYMVDANTFYTVSADAAQRFVGIGEKQQ